MAAGLLTACGGSKDNTDKNDQPSAKGDSLEVTKNCAKGYDAENTTIAFAGFKTTEKKAVNGVFHEFKIKNTKIGETHEEVFGNASFSIPIASLDTKDPGRNTRLKEKYFGSMSTTNLIKGKVIKFNADSNQVIISLKLNEIEKETVLDYTISGDSISLKGNINILDFDASGALEALHEVCGNLHTGADGVAKTWPDVDITLSSVIKEACE